MSGAGLSSPDSSHLRVAFFWVTRLESGWRRASVPAGLLLAKNQRFPTRSQLLGQRHRFLEALRRPNSVRCDDLGMQGDHIKPFILNQGAP